jgi:multicomponent Na+:H+ antiporter subunit C
VRGRAAETEGAMDEETGIEDEDDDATTDFVGLDTSPITVLGSRDVAALRDDAPVDRPERPARPAAPREQDGGDDA